MRQFDLLIKKKGGSWDPARAPFIQVRFLIMLLTTTSASFTHELFVLAELPAADEPVQVG
jgi:hypothetical protein